MRCPVDDTDLVMADRQGIEIDYCPKCRGVWLDRGELDKIIDRSGSDRNHSDRDGDNNHPPRSEERRDHDRPRQYEERRRDSRDYDDDDNYRGSEERYDEHNRGKKHKKEGFLGDLFDF